MAIPFTIHKKAFKICLSLLLLLGAETGNVFAQTDTAAVDTIQALPIAVFSYSKAYNSMADHAIVAEQVNILKQQYDEELKRAEEEFNKKYEDFLKSQAKLAPAIRNKRQAEIQQYLQTNMAFKAEAQKAIAEKEAELLAPLKEKLQQTINDIALEFNYLIILNSDNDACPFFDQNRITDITNQIINRLRK